MPDIKAMYKTVMDDSFPDSLTIEFGSQKLIYRKRVWVIGEDGQAVKKGLR